MQTVLLVIHLMIAAALVGVVLMQQSEGGGLGIGGGGGGGGAGGFLTGRGTANLLTRTTAGLAACFFATSIILTIMAQNGANAPSAFDANTPAPAADGAKPAAGAGDKGDKAAEPNLFDQLQKGEGSTGLPSVPQSR